LWECAEVAHHLHFGHPSVMTAPAHDLSPIPSDVRPAVADTERRSIGSLLPYRPQAVGEATMFGALTHAEYGKGQDRLSSGGTTTTGTFARCSTPRTTLPTSASWRMP
jgi:hypothetical protein